MDKHIDQLGDAYSKFSIDPCEENFKVLQELTGMEEMQDVFDATGASITEAVEVKPLQNLQKAVDRLHNERAILLQDQRIQTQAQRQLNPRLALTVNQHLQTLRKSIVLRIKQLTRDDAGQRRLQSKIFGLCCRRYQEKIKEKKATILGPHAYEIAADREFQQDAKGLNHIMELADPKEKLAFFDVHVSTLQDKYLPGRVDHERLCQLMVITLTEADNPQLIHEIELVDRLVTVHQRKSNVGFLLKAASVAVYMIQREALPDLPAEPPPLKQAA